MPRWTLALRAYDAITTGACQRNFAERLIADRGLGVGWRSDAPSLRLRAPRLISLSHTLVGRGFADRFLGFRDQAARERVHPCDPGLAPRASK